MQKKTAAAIALGALAGVGVGVYESFAQAVKETIVITREHKPDMEKHRFYQKSMELYLELYEDLKETFHKYH